MKIPKLTWKKSEYFVNEGVEGDTLEQQIERLIQNKEPIKDGAPLVYTERAEGVRAEMDIRTDRFEIAIDATSKIQKSYQTRREEAQKARQEEKDGEPKPIHGTTEKAPEGPVNA